MSAVADQVLRQREKAIIWTAYPHLQKAITAMLLSLGINVKPFLASLDQKQRARLVEEFNTPGEDKLQVLACSYLVSLAGYNMQGACRKVHIFDPPTGESACIQAIGRTYHIGQKYKGTTPERPNPVRLAET